jgi:NDP-sugar pyrophosphorylase family protein
MSVVIVPLAGPDFYTEKFGIRPLFPVSGLPLIEFVLPRRPWFSACVSGESQLIFVLRDVGLHTQKMKRFLEDRFPFARAVILSHLTHGAPMSALAGLSLASDFKAPVVVDLCDIYFDTDFDLDRHFAQHPEVDAVVPSFQSNDSKFSYLELDGMNVRKAREKMVISSSASAGVYIFRDAAAYFRCMTFCIETPEYCKIGSSYFVCPSVNGLIRDGRQVHAVTVGGARPIGELFHDE